MTLTEALRRANALMGVPSEIVAMIGRALAAPHYLPGALNHYAIRNRWHWEDHLPGWPAPPIDGAGT